MSFNFFYSVKHVAPPPCDVLPSEFYERNIIILDPEMHGISQKAAFESSLAVFLLKCFFLHVPPARGMHCNYPCNRWLLIDLCPAHLSQSANVFTKRTALSPPAPQCNEATERARPPSSPLSFDPVLSLVWWF